MLNKFVLFEAFWIAVFQLVTLCPWFIVCFIFRLVRISTGKSDLFLRLFKLFRVSNPVVERLVRPLYSKLGFGTWVRALILTLEHLASKFILFMLEIKSRLLCLIMLVQLLTTFLVTVTFRHYHPSRHEPTIFNFIRFSVWVLRSHIDGFLNCSRHRTLWWIKFSRRLRLLMLGLGRGCLYRQWWDDLWTSKRGSYLILDYIWTWARRTILCFVRVFRLTCPLIWLLMTSHSVLAF